MDPAWIPHGSRLLILQGPGGLAINPTLDRRTRDLLRDVSRSFYLTLRFLPGPIRLQIGLAYLLARASDTIADTDALPRSRRLEALSELRAAIEGDGSVSPPSLTDELSGIRVLPAERVLLSRLGDFLDRMMNLSNADRERVKTVLRTIVSGQKLDLVRFDPEGHPGIRALESEEELDDYLYRVAGCVGEFWTEICRAHLPGGEEWGVGEVLGRGIRFGKGLQLVNVLRDLSSDLAENRCYLPASRLKEVGLSPGDLFDSGAFERLRPLYSEYLDRAFSHLAAGWDYTCGLPRGWSRLRVVSAWPILIGVKTLGRLGEVTDPLAMKTKVKVKRSEVYRIMGCTVAATVAGRFPGLFDRYA